MPCALTTRPTTRSMDPLLVGVHHVDADAPAADAGDERAQRSRGAAAAADDLAEVFGVHVHLHGAATPVVTMSMRSKSCVSAVAPSGERS